MPASCAFNARPQIGLGSAGQSPVVARKAAALGCPKKGEDPRTGLDGAGEVYGGPRWARPRERRHDTAAEVGAQVIGGVGRCEWVLRGRDLEHRLPQRLRGSPAFWPAQRRPTAQPPLGQRARRAEGRQQRDMASFLRSRTCAALEASWNSPFRPLERTMTRTGKSPWRSKFRACSRATLKWSRFRYCSSMPCVAGVICTSGRSEPVQKGRKPGRLDLGSASDEPALKRRRRKLAGPANRRSRT